MFSLPCISRSPLICLSACLSPLTYYAMVSVGSFFFLSFFLLHYAELNYRLLKAGQHPKMRATCRTLCSVWCFATACGSTKRPSPRWTSPGRALQQRQLAHRCGTAHATYPCRPTRRRWCGRRRERAWCCRLAPHPSWTLRQATRCSGKLAGFFIFFILFVGGSIFGSRSMDNTPAHAADTRLSICWSLIRCACGPVC